MVSLVIQADGEAQRVRALAAGTLTIGRKSDNDIHLDDSTVSGRHAKIVTYFSASHIEDLGSTNGTFVNGRRVRMHTLRPGDVVAIGRHTLTVQDQDQVPAAPAPKAMAEHTMVLSSEGLDRALAELNSAAAEQLIPETPAGETADARPEPGDSASAPAAGGAYLRVMVGPDTGKRIVLGDSGAELEGDVKVQRAEDGFVLGRGSTGGLPVLLNSREVGGEPVPLKDMDMLQVGSVWLAFFAR